MLFNNIYQVLLASQCASCSSCSFLQLFRWLSKFCLHIFVTIVSSGPSSFRDFCATSKIFELHWISFYIIESTNWQQTPTFPANFENWIIFFFRYSDYSYVVSNFNWNLLRCIFFMNCMKVSQKNSKCFFRHWNLNTKIVCQQKKNLLL